jgi:hypothetical protein
MANRPILSISKHCGPSPRTHAERSEIVQVEVRTRSIVGTHIGGEVQAQADASSAPHAPENFRIHDSKSEPPQRRNPLSTVRPPITERGNCEQCGEPFTSQRNAWSLRYSSVPAKRFCSEACRKRAERARAKLRKAGDAS